MYVRALPPDNGIFLFFQSVCREFVWEQRIRPGSLCRASVVYFICLCSLPCVGDSINPFSHHVNRFILLKTSPANDGQQTVRLAITFRHPLSLLSQLFRQGGAALRHILPCGFKLPGVPRVCHIAGATGVLHQQ